MNSISFAMIQVLIPSLLAFTVNFFVVYNYKRALMEGEPPLDLGMLKPREVMVALSVSLLAIHLDSLKFFSEGVALLITAGVVFTGMAVGYLVARSLEKPTPT